MYILKMQQIIVKKFSVLKINPFELIAINFP